MLEDGGAGVLASGPRTAGAPPPPLPAPAPYEAGFDADGGGTVPDEAELDEALMFCSSFRAGWYADPTGCITSFFAPPAPAEDCMPLMSGAPMGL